MPRLEHLLSSDQFTRELIEVLHREADSLNRRYCRPSDWPLTFSERIGRLFGARKPIFRSHEAILASFFYEVSTRTRMSFESAAHRLGMSVITTEDATEFSSAVKGETLEDTIRNVMSYAHVIVLRHPEAGSAERAAKVSEVPVVNAGDGANQHPSQTLLDLYTLKEEVGQLLGLRIAMVGDLKNGRTVHSLLGTIGMYHPAAVYLISPESLRMPTHLIDRIKADCPTVIESEDLNFLLPVVDVIYMTRIQKERFKNLEDYEAVKGCYSMGPQEIAKMQKHARLVHPLPRLDEIGEGCDKYEQAAYFRQSAYGVPVRMAIIKHLMGL